jgi:hypothetical protein
MRYRLSAVPTDVQFVNCGVAQLAQVERVVRPKKMLQRHSSTRPDVSSIKLRAAYGFQGGDVAAGSLEGRDLGGPNAGNAGVIRSTVSYSCDGFPDYPRRPRSKRSISDGSTQRVRGFLTKWQARLVGNDRDSL